MKKKVTLQVPLDTLAVIDEIVNSGLLGNTREKVINHVLRQAMFEGLYGHGKNQPVPQRS